LSEHDTTNAGAPERAIRVIKRYTNRKLYDTVESRYVTLDEIAEMVKAGTEVQIVDNRTKEDLTSVTLAQIIFEEEKKTSRMPLPMLREIIRTGGSKLHAFISDELTARVTAIRSEAEHAVARVFRREENEAAPQAERRASALEQAQAFIRSSRHGFEEWQRNLDERLHRAVETVTGLPTLHREVQALRDKLAELERKLDEHK
jgi:polyhydroxyalkanoate synthesis repressor PhaR